MRVLPECHFAALVQLQEALRSERRGWGWKSLTRHHFAHVVQRRDGALKTREVSVQIRPWALVAVHKPPRVAQRRGVPLKKEKLQVQILPRGPFLECQPDKRVPMHRDANEYVPDQACGASPRHSAILHMRCR